MHVKSRGVELAGCYLEGAIGSQIDQLAAGCLGSESGDGGIGWQCAVECHSAALPLSAVQVWAILRVPCGADGFSQGQLHDRAIGFTLQPDVGLCDVHVGRAERSEKSAAVGEQPPPGSFPGAIAPGQGVAAEQLNLGVDRNGGGVA